MLVCITDGAQIKTTNMEQGMLAVMFATECKMNNETLAYNLL